MFKILYLPSASYVVESAYPYKQVILNTKEKALKVIQKNNFYEGIYGDILIYRKDYELHESNKIKKHFFDVIDIN